MIGPKTKNGTRPLRPAGGPCRSGPPRLRPTMPLIVKCACVPAGSWACGGSSARTVHVYYLWLSCLIPLGVAAPADRQIPSTTNTTRWSRQPARLGAQNVADTCASSPFRISWRPRHPLWPRRRSPSCGEHALAVELGRTPARVARVGQRRGAGAALFPLACSHGVAARRGHATTPRTPRQVEVQQLYTESAPSKTPKYSARDRRGWRAT